MFMGEYKVYKYTFPNGLIYIGVTKHSIQQRRDNGYGHNPQLREAIKSFGWKSVKTEILEDNLAEEEAFIKEIKYIKKFYATDPNVGYNKSFGGKTTYKGLKHTDEYKHNMSEKYKGKVFSQETLNKMKQAHRKEYVPVIQFDLLGGKVADYTNLTNAALSINGYKSNISRACKTGKPYKGYIWKLKGGDEG